MKASLSRREIVERYDNFDGRMAVMVFDSNGKRLMTYLRMGLYRAMAEMARAINKGNQVRIFLDLPEQDINSCPTTIADIDASKLWKPEYSF